MCINKHADVGVGVIITPQNQILCKFIYLVKI